MFEVLGIYLGRLIKIFVFYGGNFASFGQPWSCDCRKVTQLALSCMNFNDRLGCGLGSESHAG